MWCLLHRHKSMQQAPLLEVRSTCLAAFAAKHVAQAKHAWDLIHAHLHMHVFLFAQISQCKYLKESTFQVQLTNLP